LGVYGSGPVAGGSRIVESVESRTRPSAAVPRARKTSPAAGALVTKQPLHAVSFPGAERKLANLSASPVRVAAAPDTSVRALGSLRTTRGRGQENALVVLVTSPPTRFMPSPSE